MSNALSIEIETIGKDWISAIQKREFDWFERNLADDFSFTTTMLSNVALNKAEFIENDKNILETEIEFLQVTATEVNDIVLSHTIATIVKEVFDPAIQTPAGLPSAEELGEYMTGKTFAYASAWRRNGAILQCFDHHLIGQVNIGTEG